MRTTTTTTPKTVTINRKSRLYVIPCGSGKNAGYSCLGFDVLDQKGAAICKELGYIWKERKGSKKAYKRYKSLISTALGVYQNTGKRLECDLTPQLIGLEGRRVEVVTSYGETERFIVGRSTGWIPCHIALCRKDSSGGGRVVGDPFKSVRVL
jgi:hypothetical protein